MIYLCFLFYLLIDWLIERERVGDRAERDKGRESQAGSTLSTPDTALELRNLEIMTWVKIKIWMLNQLSHPGAPKCIILK